MEIIPLFVVPVFYYFGFAQAAFIHEWTIYYFCVPLAISSAHVIVFLGKVKFVNVRILMIAVFGFYVYGGVS